MARARIWLLHLTVTRRTEFRYVEGSTTINASNKPSSTEEITAIHSTLFTPVSFVNRLWVAFDEHEGREELHDIQLLSLLFRCVPGITTPGRLEVAAYATTKPYDADRRSIIRI